MNPLFRIDFSISDSLKIVRKSVLIYETIILLQPTVQLTYLLSQTQQFKLRKQPVKVEQLRTPLIIWTTL